MVSMIRMASLHVAVLVQQSTACQVTVTRLLQGPTMLVMAERKETVTEGQHRSLAVGGVMVVPHCTVRLLRQLIVGGVVSTTLMTWEQKELFWQQSVAFQVKVMSSWHGPRMLVVTLTRLTLTAVQQASKAVGGVGVQVLPHWTTRLLAQVRVGVEGRGRRRRPG